MQNGTISSFGTGILVWPNSTSVNPVGQHLNFVGCQARPLWGHDAITTSLNVLNQWRLFAIARDESWTAIATKLHCVFIVQSQARFLFVGSMAARAMSNEDFDRLAIRFVGVARMQGSERRA